VKTHVPAARAISKLEGWRENDDGGGLVASFTVPAEHGRTLLAVIAEAFTLSSDELIDAIHVESDHLRSATDAAAG
jgi:hypothetical protein